MKSVKITLACLCTVLAVSDVFGAGRYSYGKYHIRQYLYVYLVFEDIYEVKTVEYFI